MIAKVPHSIRKIPLAAKNYSANFAFLGIVLSNYFQIGYHIVQLHYKPCFWEPIKLQESNFIYKINCPFGNQSDCRRAISFTNFPVRNQSECRNQITGVQLHLQIMLMRINQIAGITIDFKIDKTKTY
mgnify:CR=1 FL=1